MTATECCVALEPCKSGDAEAPKVKASCWCSHNKQVSGGDLGRF